MFLGDVTLQESGKSLDTAATGVYIDQSKEVSAVMTICDVIQECNALFRSNTIDVPSCRARLEDGLSCASNLWTVPFWNGRALFAYQSKISREFFNLLNNSTRLAATNRYTLNLTTV